MVTEPTAAATTFGLNNPDTDATVLVFDLGGGTLDVSLLDIGEGVCDVKAATGDNNLGGDDWTLRSSSTCWPTSGRASEWTSVQIPSP